MDARLLLFWIVLQVAPIEWPLFQSWSQVAVFVMAVALSTAFLVKTFRERRNGKDEPERNKWITDLRVELAELRKSITDLRLELAELRGQLAQIAERLSLSVTRLDAIAQRRDEG